MASGNNYYITKFPIRVLSLIFLSWKALILLISISSPGIGYDSSSDMLASDSNNMIWLQDAPSSINSAILKLVRWDAIYYTEISRYGHVFEQEWAFGKGASTVFNSVVQVIGSGDQHDVTIYAFVGVLLSHLAHWLSVVLLFMITNITQEPVKQGVSAVPFTAAVLHIMSPAGIFLSAPCSESLFSFLNMLGFFLYAKSVHGSDRGVRATALICKLFAGVAFGFATIVRSNGILSGIPFFIDAVEILVLLFGPEVDNFARSGLLLQLQFVVLAGCCVAAGMIYPQLLAYREYCMDGFGQRSWCNERLPSIYTFVQAFYWNVGFLKYWTLSNVPLFVLALPCLYLLIKSGIASMHPAFSTSATVAQKTLFKIALPQLVLALLAVTNYHVQIITRLASGYPVWYIWMAQNINVWKHSSLFVHIIIMYALIQAGLYASFLPPA